MSTKMGLIDGDSFVYRAGFAVEKTKYLVTGPGIPPMAEFFDTHKEVAEFMRREGCEECLLWTRKEVGTLENAIQILDGLLTRACNTSGCGVDRFVYLSPNGPTFRDKLATLKPYKGNRASTPRPTYYSELRDHLVRNWNTHIAKDEEADDKISWVARYHKENRRDYIIIGIDKDLRQIPGTHFNWLKEGWCDVSEDESRIALWVQALCGDSSDNVGGCWKIGEKGAVDIVINAPGLTDELVWPTVVSAYGRSQSLPGCPYKDKDPQDVAVETVRLVRLKHTAYEKLWNPPPIKEEVVVKEEQVEVDAEAGWAEAVEQAAI